MLIKAKHDNFKGITAGKVYEGTECSDGYTYTNDQGKHDYAHKSHFEVMQSHATKEKTMKIKAKFDDVVGGYEAGDILEACIQIDEYIFKDKYETPRHRHIEEFDVVPDEPAIEVGSVWVSSNGVDWTVAYVGKYVIIKRGNQELAVNIDKFKEKWTPKPKTVTMYFYKDGIGGFSAFSQRLAEPCFTREIELP